MLTLKLERIRVGLTQEALAERTGVSQTRISLVERALTEATTLEREALARALGVSARKLFHPIAPPARPGPAAQLSQAAR